MSTPDTGRYVVLVRPQLCRDGSGTWRAQYPEADWCVTGENEQQARDSLRDEFERRLQHGETETAPKDDLFERRLVNPIPGVYAIDRDIYMALRGKPNTEERSTVSLRLWTSATSAVPLRAVDRQGGAQTIAVD
ncbi:hypothetical protein [Mycobacteroides abscessus]|uniref:hypothetical protein n=1 Tax=Mycobacteroides abscessus TaxID=36809 RepID=UPI00266CF5BD|nr:hypothetical protein [Mycobacteroides abscessus]MDO2969893.1 hypothetical protein [Mycobacteroides abscessus subsp. bolletii]MDO3079894.1 hypothetical protein [Mycobacteroides abscessus subsp. bolletii]